MERSQKTRMSLNNPHYEWTWNPSLLHLNHLHGVRKLFLFLRIYILPHNNADESPLTGPAYFEIRRNLWRTGHLYLSQNPVPPNQPVEPSTTLTSALALSASTSTSSSQPPKRPLTSLERLEISLAKPHAEESEEIWKKGGLKDIYKCLNDGKKLAKGMRLGLVVSSCPVLSSPMCP